MVSYVRIWQEWLDRPLHQDHPSNGGFAIYFFCRNYSWTPILHSILILTWGLFILEELDTVLTTTVSSFITSLLGVLVEVTYICKSILVKKRKTQKTMLVKLELLYLGIYTCDFEGSASEQNFPILNETYSGFSVNTRRRRGLCTPVLCDAGQNKKSITYFGIDYDTRRMCYFQYTRCEVVVSLLFAFFCIC